MPNQPSVAGASPPPSPQPAAGGKPNKLASAFSGISNTSYEKEPPIDRMHTAWLCLCRVHCRMA
jgi:hypothetical protein